MPVGASVVDCEEREAFTPMVVSIGRSLTTCVSSCAVERDTMRCRRAWDSYKKESTCIMDIIAEWQSITFIVIMILYLKS